MKTFHCTFCQSLVFFENSKCLNCQNTLAFSPDRMEMMALRPAEDGKWEVLDGSAESVQRQDETLRLCENYTAHSVCNWSISASASGSLCRSCSLTHTVPDLGVPGNLEAWAKLETAKRRLVYALLTLELPLKSRIEDPTGGLQFEFLRDSITASGDRARVLTGHDDGVITINVAEADDVYREAQRKSQNEPYRTLLGHFRHEIGHYYWDRLIAGSPRLEEFRGLFGDERADYQAALTVHYDRGPPPDWNQHHISAYASTHPWEDWAESWAHVMHMVDALETSYEVGLSASPPRPDEPRLSVPRRSPLERLRNFDQLLREWTSLTYILNNLTRGLGLADAYPFVLSAQVIDKLRFVTRTMYPLPGQP